MAASGGRRTLRANEALVDHLVSHSLYCSTLSACVLADPNLFVPEKDGRLYPVCACSPVRCRRPVRSEFLYEPQPSGWGPLLPVCGPENIPGAFFPYGQRKPRGIPGEFQTGKNP